jgi:hypothetical protein
MLLAGIVHDVLSADNEGKAFEAILKATHGLSFLPDPAKPVKAWNTDAEHKPRLSMDVLRVNLGLEQLDPTKQPGYAPPAAPVDPNNPAAALAVILLHYAYRSGYQGQAGEHYRAAQDR